MKHRISHDTRATHIDWEHPGVSACMIDWFWSNLEKGFILWHPEEHEPLEWVIAPKQGDILGAIHNAPQTWSDGRRRDLFIRYERLEELPSLVSEYIEYEHVVAGLGLERGCLAQPDPMGYRIHQWRSEGGGVIGRSSAIGTRMKEDEAAGKVWAAHCAQEIGNWAAFLPQLHTLYEVVKDPRRNPFADLSVAGRGAAARYRFMSASPSL
ncbi:MAG: hypothetical protein QM718_08750 [Steroidobacteraceae bacterium]